MKKITLLLLLVFFFCVSETKAQFTLASDNAENYTTWNIADNNGFGFGTWNLWNTNNAGWFLGSSIGQGFGDVNTNSKSFSLWGNPSGANQSNAQRQLDGIWSDGATFTIQLAVAYRNGNKGIDLFASGFDNIWNFNVSNDKYYTGGTAQDSWTYSQTSIFTISATQNGSNINITVTRGLDTYSTTITGKTLYAFKIYNGSTEGGNDLNNLHFNNLTVTYNDWDKVPANKKVEVTSDATIVTDKSVAGFIVDNGSIVEVAAGKQLTVNGDLSNNGTLTLKSDATDGTATIITKGTISGSGNNNINQYLTYRSWYLTSPVSSATPFGMSVIKSYDEASNTWSDHTSTMLAQKGYIVTPIDDEDESILFTGTSLNTGNQNITLTSRVGITNKAGFNLIGNPYPSYLDWKLVCDNATNASKMRSKTMWYRTKSGVYTFETVNGASGEGTPETASRYIPPMQAFWVRAVDGGGTLSLKNDMRANRPGTNNALKAPAVKTTENIKLRLQVSNGTNQDETLLYFNPNALNELDAYDSPKMSNDQAAIPEIYTIAGSEILAINGMKNYTYNEEIPLGFVTGESNSFSIKAIQTINFDSDVKIMLKDNQNLLQPETDITDGSAYTFNSNKVNSNDRFSIIFRSASGTSGCCTNNEYKDILVFQNANKQICIDLSSDLYKVNDIAIYNAMGQRITENKVQRTNTIINIALETGVYFVKLNIDNKYITRKIIVK